MSAAEKTWKPAQGVMVCIWCYRAADLCTIEDPCNGRIRWEADQERNHPMNTPTTKIEYALQAPSGQVASHTGTLPKAEGLAWWTENYTEVVRLRDKLTDAVLDMGLPLPGYVIVQRVTTTTVEGPMPVYAPTKESLAKGDMP